MKKLISILFLIISSIFFVSCYSTEGLEQYVGSYSIYTNYKRTYHYSYGNTKLVSENKLIFRAFTLVIKDDATVEVTYDNKEVVTGKVSTTLKTIKFRNIDYLSDYKFEYKETSEGRILDYTYHPTKIGLEYDYQVERFALIKKE